MPPALGDDGEKKQHSAALGVSRDSFFLQHTTDLKNSNYSVHPDVLGIHWARPGDAAVTTLSSRGLNTMEVYFLLL